MYEALIWKPQEFPNESRATNTAKVTSILDFNLSYRAHIIIKTTWSWHKIRHVDQWPGRKGSGSRAWTDSYDF